MSKTNIFHTVNANEIKEISITGRRWFQRSYGNTYHSVMVSVVVSRETANRLDPEAYPLENVRDVWIDLAYVRDVYGYDRHFEHTALDILREAVIDAPASWKDDYHYICQLATALNVPYSENVYDVNRKKDM